jgi:hypothetical protein
VLDSAAILLMLCCYWFVTFIVLLLLVYNDLLGVLSLLSHMLDDDIDAHYCW